MLFPLLIISLAGIVSRACRYYVSRHSQYARILPPSSFFLTSAWLKHLQLVWKSSQGCDWPGCDWLSATVFPELLGAQTLFTCVPLALWPYSQSWLPNHRFTQSFVGIIRAGEIWFVPVPALPSIPASLFYSRGEDCDTSASPSVLPVVPWADAVNASCFQQPWVKLRPCCLLHKPQSVCRTCAPFLSNWSCEGPSALPILPQCPQGQLWARLPLLYAWPSVLPVCRCI